MVGGSSERPIHAGKPPSSFNMKYLRWYDLKQKVVTRLFCSDDCKYVNEIFISEIERKINQGYSNAEDQSKGRSNLGNGIQEERILVSFKCFSCGSINECQAMNYMNCLNCSKENANVKSSYFNPKKGNSQHFSFS